MANQGTVSEERVSLSKADLAALVAAGAQSFREAQKDPQKEAKDAAARARLAAEQARQREMKEWRSLQCGHVREDGSSAMAWQKTSDDRINGVCQRCNSEFSQDHPRFSELYRIPTKVAHLNFY